MRTEGRKLWIFEEGEKTTGAFVQESHDNISHYEDYSYLMYWHKPLISALGQQRKVDQTGPPSKFKVSQGYTVRTCANKN